MGLKDKLKKIGETENNKDIDWEAVKTQWVNRVDQLYKKICQLNFANKTALFMGLEKIKRLILDSNDVNLFAIPIKNDKLSVFLRGYGEMEVSPGTVKLVDTDEIDKQRYFDIYISPFTKSIVKEYA